MTAATVHELPGAVELLADQYHRVDGQRPGLFRRKGKDLVRLLDASVEVVRAYWLDRAEPWPLADTAGAFTGSDVRPDLYDVRVHLPGGATVELAGVALNTVTPRDGGPPPLAFLDHPEVVEANGGRRVARPTGRDGLAQVVEAIWACSGSVEYVRQSDRLGWHERDGAMVFHHAGGGIDATGHRSDVSVRTSDLTRWFRLPEPTTSPEDGHRAFLAAMRPFDVTDDPRIGAPLVCATWAALMGRAAGAVVLDARNRSGKSGLMALVVQHVAPSARWNRFPTPGADHDNVREAGREHIFHVLGDVAVPLDDISTDTSPEAQRRQAAGIVRSLYNGAYRFRMNRDRTAGDVRRPRCLGLVTIENFSAQESAEARAHVVALDRGQVDREGLEAADRNGEPLARATMAATFLRWWAERISDDEIDRRRQAAAGWLRRQLPDVDMRYIGVGANLLAGGWAVVECAQSLEFIDDQTATGYRDLIAAGMVESTRYQADRAVGSALPDKVRRWVEAMFAAGDIYATDAASDDGLGRPDAPHRWGWPRGDHDPRAERVGWAKADDPYTLYATPEALYRALVRYSVAQQDPITATKEALADTLAGAGIISTTTASRGGGARRRRNGRQVKVAGTMHRVWDFRRLVEPDDAGPDDPAEGPPPFTPPVPCPACGCPIDPGDPCPSCPPAGEAATAAQTPADGPEAPPAPDPHPEAPEAATGAGGGASGDAGGLTVVAVGDGWVATRTPDGWRHDSLAPCPMLPGLVKRIDQAAPPGPVTVIIAEGRHTLYGLPEDPQGAGSVALMSALHAAGYHRPDQPDQPARVPGDRPSCPELARVAQDGTLRLVPASWLGPGDFPRVAALDGTEAPDVLTLGDRVAAFHARTGWVHEGSTAATCVRIMRDLAETAKVEPRFQGGRPDRADIDRRPAPHAIVDWRRDPEPGELDGATHVHRFDAVRNYLAAYQTATWSRTELAYEAAPQFDEKVAGYWRVRVPAMPEHRVPPPIVAPEGAEVWTTTDRLRLYVALGVDFETIDGWLAPVDPILGTRRWEPRWRRTFVAAINRHVTDIEALGDAATPADRAVHAAVKALYKRGHGKLRSGQRVMHRPDWGWAIQDRAWFSVCWAAYRAAGLVPLRDGTRTSEPRFPLRVSTDELAYAGPADLPAPAGIDIAPRLGGFRESGAVTIDEWRNSA